LAVTATRTPEGLGDSGHESQGDAGRKAVARTPMRHFHTYSESQAIHEGERKRNEMIRVGPQNMARKRAQAESTQRLQPTWDAMLPVLFERAFKGEL